MQLTLDFIADGTTRTRQQSQLIEHRSRVIGYAIDARGKRYPEETPYQYQPFVESGKEYVWNEEARAGLRDYNLQDLSI